MIHVIDKVLLPPDSQPAARRGRWSTSPAPTAISACWCKRWWPPTWSRH
ncbi:MAG: hypothetical protein R3E68_10575 [Burkholderiaceae bacterium]